MHRTTYFVSDLHLFCRRFDGERFWNRLLDVHTHLAMSSFAHQGVRFHNCGAPIGECTFGILEDVVAW